MANFTPQMLRDLLESQDPKDQELARQLSDLEFSNETGRLANYPAPRPYGMENEAARLGNYPPPAAQAPGQSALNSKYIRGSIGDNGSGGMAVQDIPFPVTPTPRPRPAAPRPTTQPPDMGSGDSFVPMTGGSQPVPLGLNAFEQAAWRRANYGPGDTSRIPSGSGSISSGGNSVQISSKGPDELAVRRGENIRVLDQMRQKDGSIFQLIEQETPRGMVRTTRVVMPDELDPYKQAAAKADKLAADTAYTKAQTIKANRPEHYQPVIKDIVDPKDPTRMIAVDANVYKGGSLGSPGVVAVSGKEPSSAKRQETVQAGLESFQTLTSGLRNAYGTLLQNGDIASSGEDKTTVGNVMNRIQSSGLGQAVGKAVGTKSQDERNAITSSKNILLQSIMQATGMTARQLDSNVELKMWINSITDPSNTYESNMKILDNIEKFVSTKANAISRLNSGRAEGQSDKQITMDDVFSAAKKTGKSLDQVRKDAMAKGYSIRGM